MEAAREMVVSGLLKNVPVKESEFDIVRNPHPHPLIFYRQGRLDGGRGEEEGIFCFICGQSLRPPAFGCSKGCNFYFHQSCIELPPTIPNPFCTSGSDDPEMLIDYLSLSISNNSPCNRYGQNPYGPSYVCHDERFRLALDLQCAIAVDPKASCVLTKATASSGGDSELIRHFSHPHPLTTHLQTESNRGNRNTIIPVCLVCQRPIKLPSNYYFCSQSLPHCRSYFIHTQCAELPRQILNPDLHRHSLFLNTNCLICRSECTKFFYSCPPCFGFMNLHVDCVSSFKHKHDFQILRSKLPKYECQLCLCAATNSFPWFCTVCHLFAHQNCAISEMSQHLYHLPSTQTSSDNTNIIPENEIDHFSHEQHKLSLCELGPGEDRHCAGCMRGISTHLPYQSYACPPCGFYLRQECATLPTRLGNYSIFLHPHELSMVYIPDFVFSCAICRQYCHGFAYHCKECHYAIDIRCAGITIFPFTHPSHHHPLLYYDGKEKCKCECCGEELKHKKSVGCEDCNFYLDLRCAHLPLAIRNRFDEHPLILTFANLPLPARKRFYEECLELGDVEDDWKNNNYSFFSFFYSIFWRSRKR